MKGLRTVIWLAAVVLVGGCKEDAAAPSAPRPVVSEVLTPQAGLQPNYVGTVEPRVQTELGFPLAGTLAERPVEEGDVVKKGAILARLDPQQLEAQLRAAQAGVAVATAQLRSAQDSADRTNALVQRGVSTTAAAEAEKSALAAAQARLVQAKASEAQAKQLLDFATLTAPQDGVITKVYAQPGATLNPAEHVVQLAATGEREVIIDLSEEGAAGLAPGAVFRVALEAAPQITASATLRRIDPVTDPATRTRRVHLTLGPDAPSGFRLGALVLVRPGAQTKAQLTLPVTALVGGGPSVWVVGGASRTVSRRDIVISTKLAGRVVVQSGLRAGDEVVLKGVNSLKDGQSVGPSVPR